MWSLCCHFSNIFEYTQTHARICLCIPLCMHYEFMTIDHIILLCVWTNWREQNEKRKKKQNPAYRECTIILCCTQCLQIHFARCTKTIYPLGRSFSVCVCVYQSLCSFIRSLNRVARNEPTCFIHGLCIVQRLHQIIFTVHHIIFFSRLRPKDFSLLNTWLLVK